MRKLLIVEDESFQQEILVKKFTNIGYEVVLAKDGAEAIETIKTFHPDVILLDILMPKKDGVEMLMEIRKLPEFKTTPVIILSNIDDNSVIRSCFQHGATNYLIKTNSKIETIQQAIEDALPETPNSAKTPKILKK